MEDFIFSIQSSGFHRTDSEIQNKSSIKEQVGGVNITYKPMDGNWSAGLNLVGTNLGVPLYRREANYNRFEFKGRNNHAGSLFTSLLWQNLNIFGEAGMSKSGGVGAIGGLIAGLSDQLSISVVLRNYDRDFHSFYGNAFGETSRNINEKGILLGIKVLTVSTGHVYCLLRLLSVSLLRFRAAAPSTGFEYLMRLNFKLNKSLNFYGQYRQESKDREFFAWMAI